MVTDAQVWVCLVLIGLPRRQLLCVRYELVFSDIIPVSVSLPYAPLLEDDKGCAGQKKM